MNKQICEDPYQVVECLKCDNRFLRVDFEDKVCGHCDNTDLMETIFMTPEEFDRCNCKQCNELRNNVNSRKQ